MQLGGDDFADADTPEAAAAWSALKAQNPGATELDGCILALPVDGETAPEVSHAAHYCYAGPV
jgi:hypothetical protein